MAASSMSEPTSPAAAGASSPTPWGEFPASLPLPSADDSDPPNFAYPSWMHDRLIPLFERTVVHPAVIVPAKRTAELRRTLSHVLMHRPKMSDVHKLEKRERREGVDPKSERKLVLKLRLEEAVEVEGGGGEDDRVVATYDVYSDPALRALLSAPDRTVRKSSHSVTLDYDYLTVDQVLRRVLPPSIAEVPSSFEVVGHLAHVNLRDEALPYKRIIGRTILDKNPSLGLVVNKIGTIENEFRTFPMEVLARRREGRNGGDSRGVGGDEEEDDDDASGSGLKLEVDVREEGSRFKLDFAKVYWNSRLAGEHRRLVRLIAGKDPRRQLARKKSGKKSRRPGDADKRGANSVAAPEEYLPLIVVADAMAGVGPFAVPLTSQYRNIACHANDLNPESFHYLKVNADLNGCRADDLSTYNMDGRAFVHRLDAEGVRYDHVLMNLPASAPEFLDAFRGYDFQHRTQGEGGGEGREIADRGGGDDETTVLHRPTVHVHCFGPKDVADAERESVGRCERALGCSLDMWRDDVQVHVVRDISPKKNMLCVSFRLPLGVREVERLTLAVAEEPQSEDGDSGERDAGPVAKKCRTDNT